MKLINFFSSLAIIACSLFLFAGCYNNSRTDSSVLTLDSCSSDTIYLKPVGEDTAKTIASLKAIYVVEGADSIKDFVNACVMLRLYYCNGTEDDTVALCLTSSDMQKEVAHLYGAPLSSLSIAQVMSNTQRKLVDCYKKDTQGLESTMGYEYHVDVKLLPITDSLITCVTDKYCYYGGAHGSSIRTYDNLDLSSGRVLGFKDIFKEGIELQLRPLLIKGLCTYFDCQPDSLDQQLLFVSSAQLPLPVSAPSLTEEGIVFRYQQYEIACYAAGSPEVVIPYSELKGLMKITIPAK